jgi:hypothetical protein
VPKIVHSGKASPSAVLALGEDLTPLADSRRRFLFFIFFPECFSSPSATLGEDFCLFFKKPSSPSVAAQALGEEICLFFKKKTLFPECRSPGTRGSHL